jgi:hypothetical protein
VRDPANEDNVVSKDLSAAEKRAMGKAARDALYDENWKKILWQGSLDVSRCSPRTRTTSQLMALLRRPWCIRIKTPPNCQRNFSHPVPGENAPLLRQQGTLGQDLRKVPLHKRWARKSGFTGRKLHDRWPFGSAAAQRHYQNRFSFWT